MSRFARNYPETLAPAPREPTLAEIAQHEKDWTDTVVFNYLEAHDIDDTPENRKAYEARAVDLYMSKQ